MLNAVFNLMLCSMSLCRILLCWVSLCWMSLWWVSWSHHADLWPIVAAPVWTSPECWKGATTLSITTISIKINKMRGSESWPTAECCYAEIRYAECRLSWMSSCWLSQMMPLCWVSLCRMSLWWVSWRHHTDLWRIVAAPVLTSPEYQKIELFWFLVPVLANDKQFNQGAVVHGRVLRWDPGVCDVY